jgi:GT2 family glycosyltransferase
VAIVRKANKNKVNSKTVVAVITTYNRLAKLKKTLKITLKQDFVGVIVVNNNSTDGTKEWLDGFQAKESRLKVYNLKNNIGGAGGFNYGFKAAVKDFKAKWLVCFDDDAYPKPDMLKSFHKLDFDNSVGGVAAAVYLPDGKICEMNRPSINPFRRGMLGVIKGFFNRSSYHVTDDDYKNIKAVKAVDFCSFVGCFIRISNIKRGLGYPDKDFFIYADDLVYTKGLNNLGKDLVFVPELVFLHDQERKNKRSLLPLWRIFYYVRNNLLFYKGISGKLFYFVACYKLLVWLFKFRRYGFNWRFYRVLFRAFIDGLCGDLKRSHAEVMKFSGK